MKMSYFKDTDTLYIEFRSAGAVETRQLDENTLLEVDINDDMIALTIEHASTRMDLSHLELSGIAA